MVDEVEALDRDGRAGRCEPQREILDDQVKVRDESVPQFLLRQIARLAGHRRVACTVVDDGEGSEVVSFGRVIRTEELSVQGG